MEPMAIIIEGNSSHIPIKNNAVDLIITSPPYWNLKNYNHDLQIGFDQSLEDYLYSLNKILMECLRVLKPGRKLCVNIGDVNMRGTKNQPHQAAPIHSLYLNDIMRAPEPPLFCGSIIWKKITNISTSGKSRVVMGSYPYPTNGVMKIDYEYIDVFKKRGNTKPPADKEKSAMTKKEWFDYFLGGIWDDIQPNKQKDHPAMFPEEIPRRLIKMFSFVGDIVFDPFAGSGTTLKVAIEEKRIAIGQEIGWTENWKDIVHNKINQDISFIQMPGG